MNQSLRELHDQHAWFLVILFELLHLAACYPTRQYATRKYILGPVMIALAYNMYNHLHFHVKIKYAIGFHIGFQLCSMICFVYIERGFPDVWRRVKDHPPRAAGSKEGDNDDSTRLPSSFSFRSKIGWMLDLHFSPRRIGWIQEPKQVLPRHPTCSRWHFIRSRIIYALVNFILLDFAVSYEAGNPSFDTRIHHPDSIGPNAYMAARPLWSRFPDIVAWTIAMVNGVCLTHTAIAIPSVGLGLSEPRDWPAMFGSFWDSYTVRQFWGRSWHQRLRPILSIIGKHVAYTVCGFKPGTKASSYTQLFVAFLVSGLMHVGGDYMVFRRFTSFSLQFFLLQAVAISFEDFVIWLTKLWCARWDRRITRTIGYIWVLGWFCLVIPVWLDPLTAANLHLVDRGNITTKLINLWASRTSSLSLSLTTTAPMWLNPMNLTRLSAGSPIAEYRAMVTGTILTKALEVCVTPTYYVHPRFQDTLNAVRISLTTG